MQNRRIFPAELDNFACSRGDHRRSPGRRCIAIGDHDQGAGRFVRQSPNRLDVHHCQHVGCDQHNVNARRQLIYRADVLVFIHDLKHVAERFRTCSERGLWLMTRIATSSGSSIGG